MDQNTGDQPKRRSAIFMPLIVCLLLGIGFVLGSGIEKYLPGLSYRLEGADSLNVGAGRTFDEVLRYIDAKYVDKLPTSKIEENAINDLLSHLDPHSTYIPVEELKQVNEDMSGDFEGIGIEYLMIMDSIVVVTTLAGGPSELVGVLPGDRIVSINDSLVSDMKLETRDVSKKLRGAKGTQVKVGIIRSDSKKPLYFTIKRDQIPISSVDVAYALDNTTAFIKISKFSNKTFEEFMVAMDSLFNKYKMQNLVLDLRQNPGGYLQEATSILSQLISERGKLLVYTKGRNHNKTEYETSGRNQFTVKKIAILIDEGSASASEIVAGAIQDWDRGVIVGRRSFGKGLVQEQFNLSNGAALRLTVAKYYTPSGRCIQRNYSDFRVYETELDDRLKNGELVNGPKLNPTDTVKFFTSKGRVVYGSGGISPDIFVPADTILFSQDYLKLRQYVAEFAIRWIGKNRSNLPKDAVNFNKKISISDTDLNDFISYARARGFKDKEVNIKRVEPELKTFLKARIGRQLFGDKGYYIVMNSEDPALLKAMERIRMPKPIP